MFYYDLHFLLLLSSGLLKQTDERCVEEWSFSKYVLLFQAAHNSQLENEEVTSVHVFKNRRVKCREDSRDVFKKKMMFYCSNTLLKKFVSTYVIFIVIGLIWMNPNSHCSRQSVRNKFKAGVNCVYQERQNLKFKTVWRLNSWQFMMNLWYHP